MSSYFDSGGSSNKGGDAAVNGEEKKKVGISLKKLSQQVYLSKVFRNPHPSARYSGSRAQS